MEDTKRLKDAIRLRDAYELFVKKAKEWTDISEIEYYNGKDENWHFYKSISFYMSNESNCGIYSINIIFNHHKLSDDVGIDLFRCSFCDRLTEIKELLKDYKDLIE